ncbi:MAG: hypothetical protein H8D94_00215, partial [Candidatus Pelagibacter sp.]|nr:hypothetical protein [Candidatus Pelagibacter sp.]
MGKQNAEKLCSFANYNYNPENQGSDTSRIISSADIIACDNDVTFRTWDGEVEFRGGQTAACSLTKTYVDLFYDMLAYYGATIDMSDPTGISGTGCDNSYSAFDTSLLNPFYHEVGGVADPDNVCINGTGIMHYLQNVIGLTEAQALPIRGWMCDGNPSSTGCGSADPSDLQTIIDSLDDSMQIDVCDGGINFGKVCLSDGQCPSYEVPNFLNFTNDNNEKMQSFFNDVGVDYLNSYLFVTPEENTVGDSYVRVGIRDSGINEDGTFTQKRTGYSKVRVEIVSGSNIGPTGDLNTFEKSSFGLVPDTFTYDIDGNDQRELISQQLDRDFTLKVYSYHSDTTEDDKFIQNCINVNSKNECCADNPIPQIDTGKNKLTGFGKYYNWDNDADGSNPIYYKEEYLDEIRLYLDYYNNGNRYCKAELGNVTWEYSNTFTNDNIDGFEPPNVKYNELDYTVKYEFKIFDVVENYEEQGSQGAEDGGWWDAIGNP